MFCHPKLKASGDLPWSNTRMMVLIYNIDIKDIMSKESQAVKCSPDK